MGFYACFWLYVSGTFHNDSLGYFEGDGFGSDIQKCQNLLVVLDVCRQHIWCKWKIKLSAILPNLPTRSVVSSYRFITILPSKIHHFLRYTLPPPPQAAAETASRSTAACTWRTATPPSHAAAPTPSSASTRSSSSSRWGSQAQLCNAYK